MVTDIIKCFIVMSCELSFDWNTCIHNMMCIVNLIVKLVPVTSVYCWVQVPCGFECRCCRCNLLKRLLWNQNGLTNIPCSHYNLFPLCFCRRLNSALILVIPPVTSNYLIYTCIIVKHHLMSWYTCWENVFMVLHCLVSIIFLRTSLKSLETLYIFST